MDSEEIEKNDVILCEKDYYEHSHLKCHQCNQHITQNNYQTIGSYKYHKQCLHCPGCTIMKNLPVPGTSKNEDEDDNTLERYDYNNRPYCRYHFSLIKGTECVGCGQAVLQEYLEPTSNNGKWHQECYMIKKYWHILLIDLQPILHSDYKSKNQLIEIQNDFQDIRCSIWKELSAFEDTTSKTISSIVILNQSSAYKKEYEACIQLSKQINILFSVLDLVFFKYLTHLSCDAFVQKLSDQMVYFFDILCQTTSFQDVERLMKMATSLSQFTRDLIKLSLQQTIILERNSGQDNNYNLIDQVLDLFRSKGFKLTMDITCLDHHSRLIDMSLTRLGFVLNVNPIEGKRPDETYTLYKPQIAFNRPSLFPISHQTRMINSSSNVHYLTKATDISPPATLPRSKSTSRNPSLNYITCNLPPVQPIAPINANTIIANTTPNTPALTATTATSPAIKNRRMDTIRRALTTSRAKKESPMLSRSTSIFNQSTRRDQKSFSVHNPSTPPLFISLPDMEQLHTTPPLSPPSANQQIWTIPSYLPDLTLQQDSIIRHIALLHIESHVTFEVISLDDLLALLDFNKKSSNTSSLWGKLKTHILTPTSENSPNPFNNSGVANSTQSNEKKIGVSLSNTSFGSLNIYKMRESGFIENWKTHCPSVISCFSSHSLAPNFLKDCILAMVDKDIKTEGIFRKNGNIRGLKEMCDQLDDNPQQEDWTDFFKDQQLIQLAAFVKRYLRELPEPLLTFKLHKLFTHTNHKVEDDVKLIHYAICTLPKINRDILFLILAFLHWVARHSEDNKMGYENLARVMAPNILYNHKKQTSSSAADVSICHGEIRVVATMIEHYETLIKVPRDFTALLEHAKMAQFITLNAVDLTCSKQFVKTFGNLSKVQKDIASTLLPPSPSTSSV
ncbi:unnamed protein product [Mucor hiemalis]